MTEEDAFLQAIIENPDDDGPRLIYADWLDERGNSDRAEFIRVQCAMARMDASMDWFNSHYDQLEERASDLRRANEREWRGSPALPGDFRRGFVDIIYVSAGEFVKAADSWFHRSPIREAWIREVKRWHRRFFAMPQLARLKTLEMYGVNADARLTCVIRSLAACPYLSGLEGLNLAGNMLYDADVRILSNSPHLQSLTALELGMNGIGPAGVHALAESSLGSQLTRLDLDGCEIGVEGLRELLTSPGLGRLTSLKLGGLQFGQVLAEALPGLTPRPRLAELDLSLSGLRRSGVRELAASSLLRGLKKLNLGANWLNVAQLRELLAAAPLDSLEELDLAGNHLGYTGAQALAKWPGLSRLRFLNVVGAGIGEAGAVALANSRYSTASLLLALSGERLTKRARRDLQERLGDCLRLWFIDP